MAGYKLPEYGSPMFEVEAADLEVLRGFLALLLVSADKPPRDPVSALKAHLPEHPGFPLFGPPSDALLALKVMHKDGPVKELQTRLTQQLSAEQAAAYMILSGEY